jgi:hypothetical protein
MPGEFLGGHRPRRIPQSIERRPRPIAAQRLVRGCRQLLPDTFIVVARFEDADRRIDMVKVVLAIEVAV